MPGTFSLNADLAERFRRSYRAHKNDARPPADDRADRAPPQINKRVRQYFQQDEKGESDKVDQGPAWYLRPEMPSADKLLKQEVSASVSDTVELTPNLIRGAWDSKDAYLGAQYELLREDSLFSLRAALNAVRTTPHANEGTIGSAVGIYDKVHICSVKCSSRGLATTVTFSLGRAGKKILWRQSNRLRSGSLVVLTPKEDMYKTQAIVATVAARPIDGLELNPPQIEIFFARADEQEIDPSKEFVMVEHRNSLYEASRHTLTALQRMRREPFPLSEHLVDAKPAVSSPTSIKEQPCADLTTIFSLGDSSRYKSVNLISEWPHDADSNLDASQLQALHRILTKSLAIVQGPPGTGKTHVSVEAIRVKLASWQAGDPPIIIACQTNHAVDQILRHISSFEPDFARLGTRSKDKEVIKQRTLYELRLSERANPPQGSVGGFALKEIRKLTTEIKTLLAPLRADGTPLEVSELVDFDIITDEQASSLQTGASKWSQEGRSAEKRSPFHVWLGKSLIAVPTTQLPEDFGFEYEEADLEFEQLREIEAEIGGHNEEDDHENLKGDVVEVADNFTCRQVGGITEAKLTAILTEQDMWKTPEVMRPAVYRRLQRELKTRLLDALRQKIKHYQEMAKLRRIGLWEKDENILKRQKVIGMTMSGLSIYRGLLAALEPKVVLVEEAAETLEAPVTVACMPSVQQLILVGDHKQLRPHTNASVYEDEPYYLNVSLFERMINNNVEFDTLTKQRRMVPEIRRLLHPIYGDLIHDHDFVRDKRHRPDVPGMGGVNSFFFTHEWRESRDELMSAFNPEEADMIVGFVEYLVYNGLEEQEITILTFYNGQRKKLLSELRKRPTLTQRRFKVVTVDSYQGEENAVVILSLVRSNNRDQIGFLNMDNRICVALSRAQCGFYIFGNGQLLHRSSKTWKKVIKIIANQGPNSDRLATEAKSACRLNDQLPVCCQNHGKVTEIRHADDWNSIVGGCADKCTQNLSCGHACELTCHPFAHEIVPCKRACNKPLACGHQCTKTCGEKCACRKCRGKEDGDTGDRPPDISLATRPAVRQQESQNAAPAQWTAFARDEPRRYAEAISQSRTPSPVKAQSETPLIDFSTGDCPSQGRHSGPPSPSAVPSPTKDESKTVLIDLDTCTGSGQSVEVQQLAGGGGLEDMKLLSL